MMKNNILILVKIALLLAVKLIGTVNGQTMFEGGARFLLMLENQQLILPDSLHYSPLLKMERLEIFTVSKQKSQKHVAGITCKDIPLSQPMDSLLRLTFYTSRRLQSSALELQLNDTCHVKVLSEPEFQVLALPVKELNLILSAKIIQDEIYIDFDLPALSQDDKFDFRHLLLFEFLFQKFLLDRIARGRAFSKSVFAELTDDSRPVYAPEFHFYLDAPAAAALIKKWKNIKSAFKNQLYSNSFQLQLEQFNKKVHLTGSSDYNHLVFFSKMFLRYGIYYPIQFANIESSRKKIEFLKQTIEVITDHLIVYWFKPGVLDQKVLESLRSEIGEQNLLIFKE